MLWLRLTKNEEVYTLYLHIVRKGAKRMNPAGKYVPAEPLRLEKRRWPENALTKAPVWCSVDLRDGNQALVIPMDTETKIEYFNLLVKLGFKEIEVGFPSASEVEF